jgi:hypothetical protein
VEEGNLTTNISNLRRVLGDDHSKPKYIETVPTRGYRFIAVVKEVYEEKIESATQEQYSSNPSLEEEEKIGLQSGAYTNAAESQIFEISSHMFVPVYLGHSSEGLTVDYAVRTNRWGTYKELRFGEYTFCIFPFGVGVWHLFEFGQFNSLTDLAIWRRQMYNTILNGEHPIISYTQREVSGPGVPEKLWDSYIGKPGYVFSLFVLLKPILNDINRFQNALRLLSCPSALQAEDRPDLPRNDALLLEQEFLRSGFQSSDIREFGLPGLNIGYASWAALSLFEFDEGRGNLTRKIVEFELALQALWWFCHCTQELNLSTIENTSETNANAVEIITKQFAKLKAIGPTEPMQERTMREAILVTSRIMDLVNDTLAILNQRER